MDFLTSAPVQLLAVWLAAGFLLRLAYVVWRRERERERRQIESRNILATPDYGATDIRVAAVLGAVLAVVLAVVASWLVLDDPLDESEVEELTTNTAIAFDDRDTTETPSIDLDDVRDAIRDGGGDTDDVRVHEVSPDWLADATAYERVRFQVTNEDGEWPVCLEVRWGRSGDSAEYDVRAGHIVGIC